MDTPQAYPRVIQGVRRRDVLKSFISKMESGEQINPNAETLKRLARALGCTTDSLVGRYEEEDAEPLLAAVALVGA